MEASVELGEMQEVGPTPAGFRRIIPITGGAFEGPQIKGMVLPGGADWQIVRSDGVREIEARYTLETNDGNKIYIVNKGIIRGQSDEPQTFYFRTIPRFEVAGEKYSWLTHSLFLATVEPRQPASVYIKFYEIK
ncbi:DUF3237 family protein [Domibacillus robiginosus]|uniref:DUF3237 family protein n=1 Tax=Domibacillus robiginosus TaxID=1071054 RepID=UPI0009E3C8B4|nr:DUF3237 family protein [Domibacillus robiginosus]